jgi:undecaprenyl-diphosphatase
MSLSTAWRDRKRAYRNPVYLIFILFALLIFLQAMLLAQGSVGPFETALFRLFNQLPDWLEWPIEIISTLGSFGAIIAVAFIAVIRRHYVNAIKIILAGTSAYLTAYALKSLDIRPRPEQLLDNVIVRESAIGSNGFPSGHAAVATAIGIIVYQYVPRRFHKYVTLGILGVMASRLYLGVHLPWDLLGGYAVGLLTASFFTFLFGQVRRKGVPVEVIRRKLQERGMPIESVKQAKVDARGSSPYFATLKDGSLYFVKIVGRDNNAADWLFKLWRKIIYRRLEDEVPFFTPKRQLEHEAYVAGLAYQNGIRTPRVKGIFEAAPNKWAHVQEAIPGRSLDKVAPEELSDQLLKGIWQEVKKLHDNSIIHRDLRTANVFLDKKGQPWLIDFGFAEASITPDSNRRDTVELLASMSALVGTKRTVKAAKAVIGIEELKKAQPYLSYSVLSSATTSELKKRKDLLENLQAEVSSVTGQKEVRLERMKRVNGRMLLLLVAILLGIYVFLPQVERFRESFQAIGDARLHLLLLGGLLSLGTYLAATEVYRLISYYPLPYLRTFLVQIASSFANRLLPAGAGGLATNARYLVKHNHTEIQAASLAALNNILGLVGHLILLLIVILFSKTPLSDVLVFRLSPVFVIIGLLGLATVMMIFIFAPKIRGKARRALRVAISDFKELMRQPFRLGAALLGAMTITVMYALTLYASAHALGFELSILETFIVFTVGVAAASVTPTPGGIGGAEAGLVAGLASVGIPADQGLSIALVYRFLTYWLPIIPGFICFQIALRKNYI